MRILQEICKHADIRPDSIAIQSNFECINYHTLVERIEKYKEIFSKLGFRHGDKALISLRRDTHMHSIILALFSLGVVYVPIAQGSPWSRVSSIAKKIGARWLVGDQWNWTTSKNNLICSTPAVAEIVERTYVPLPDDLAYIIFTSGSTGEPKGVMISKNSLASFLEAMCERFSLDSSLRMLAYSSLSFDMSVPEIYLPFLIGGSVMLADDDTRGDLNKLGQLLDKCTFAQATPSLWTLLLDSGWEPRKAHTICVGGESASLSLMRRLSKSHQVWNLYGPTETTVWVSAWLFEPDAQKVILGDPLDNAFFRLFLLDELDENEFELGIAGPCVAEGYVGDSKATNNNFVVVDNQVIYKTGDIVRRYSDGSLEWRRRIDSLVKVRGHRISVLEIRLAIESFPGVSGCIIDIVGQEGAASEMVAYVTTSDQAFDYLQLRKYLQEIFPPYMIPDRCFRVASFPLNSSGKCDINELRKLTDDIDKDDPCYQKNDSGSLIERVVHKHLERLFPAAVNEPTESFRLLGLTSSRAMMIAALIGKDLGVDVPVASVLISDSTESLILYLHDYVPDLIGEYSD